MTHPASAFTIDVHGLAHASELTRGPWDPGHQHAGPPIALMCRAVEQAGAAHGLTHVARLTANLLRPVNVGSLQVQVNADYVGKSAGHFSATLQARGKEVIRMTTLMQREEDQPVPDGTAGHPLPAPPVSPMACLPAVMPFVQPDHLSYADLVENRSSDGRMFSGPCTIWFRLRTPLVAGELPSPYQRVMVAADSGNGVSAVLDYRRHIFVNSDLTVNLLRRPLGDWICLDARTSLGGNGCGLAESALYDELGYIGRATQSLFVRPRSQD